MHGYRLVLNLSTFLTIAVAVVKAGDILLLPKQQKAFQRFVDGLGASLMYLTERDQINVFLRAHKLLFSGVTMLATCLIFWPRLFWVYAPRWAFVASVALGSLFSASTLIWTIGSDSPPRRWLRAAIAAATAFLVAVLLSLSQGPTVTKPGEELALWALPNVKAYAIAASVAATTVPVLGLALWLTSVSAVALFLKLATAVVERIADGIKGAWAGFMALLALILAIVDFVVNRK